ncbi:MAG TPA: tetratricopeptide repeat protein, partial [Bryobacteraceae bacterium]|nr:tetratricopeptide repeat protein [Bryobacteraceae bacterium]
MNCVTLAAAFLALLSSAKTAIADPVQEAAQCVAHRQLARAEELIVSQMMTTPRDPDLLTLLAEVRLDQNRGPEALELIGNAEQLGGITALRAQLEGLCHLAVGRLEPAERCFRTAIRLDPNYDAAHYFLARLLYNRNRFDEAIAESNRTIDLSPGFVRAYENLGLCYEGMQQLDQAERWYLEAIRRSSAGGLKTEWPRLDLATMLIHNDRLAEAKPYI